MGEIILSELIFRSHYWFCNASILSFLVFCLKGTIILRERSWVQKGPQSYIVLSYPILLESKKKRSLIEMVFFMGLQGRSVLFNVKLSESAKPLIKCYMFYFIPSNSLSCHEKLKLTSIQDSSNPSQWWIFFFFGLC